MTHRCAPLRVLRLFVVAIGCLLVALSAGAAHAHGVTLKVHHALPAESAFHTQFLLPWTKKLEEAASGRLRFQLFAASPLAVLDQVKQGAVDIAWLDCSSAEGFSELKKFTPPSDAGGVGRASTALWDYVRANDLGKKEFDGVRLLGVATAGNGTGEPAALFALVMNAAGFKSLSDDLRQVVNTHGGAETSAWLGKVLDQAFASR
jgi:TRAP-type C4-dicarboxylate transport system substrate-binding protein